MAEDLVNQLIAKSGATANKDVLRDIVRSAVGLAGDDADRLNLKITASALREMRAAFAMFAPFEGVPKVTIFGSARTLPEDPLYAQARDLARSLAEDGWMVVTGAGPGIMAAGAEGAGPERALGVSISLPFEEKLSDTLVNGSQVVAMKYFFTRKLMLIKESSAFVCLPGGFGTQDETFELLTLLQTGKATPAPVVLLDVPGGSYWRRWVDYVDTELASVGLISPQDHELFLVTDDVAEAVAEVERTRPDAVLLDLAMPGGSGIDAIPGIRAASPSTRVIVLSGFSREHLGRRAIDAGADAYVEKGSFDHVVDALLSPSPSPAVAPG